MEKIAQIIEAGDFLGRFAAQAPVCARLRLRSAHVLRAGAGVVGPNAFSGPTTEELNNWLLHHPPKEIPQGNVNRGGSPRLHACGTESDIRREVSRDAVHSQRITTE